MNGPSYFLSIEDPSWVAESRRIAKIVAEREGLSEESAGKAAIVASELSSNLLKHAERGAVQISPLSGRGQAGIEILSIDRGPGILNLSQSLEDGHSTVGTAGTGLGAVRRLSDRFDIYSEPGKGTVIVSEIRKNSKDWTAEAFEIGSTSRPVSGESVSGDGWAVRFEADRVLIMLADGLGHGAFAGDASKAAVDSFYRSAEQAPAGLVHVMHGALRGTRGAAVAVASVEFRQGSIRFAGLGNIAGSIITPSTSHGMVSHNGTAGYSIPTIKEFTYPWTQESVIVMHSDGLSSHWNAATLPGLHRHHPSLIGAWLYRECGRERDDACVVVGKSGGGRMK